MMGIIPKQPIPTPDLGQEAEGECESEESVHPNCLNAQVFEMVLDIIEM
jgi:hypothetical protein